MWEPRTKKVKLSILATVIAITLGIHYGWVIEPLFGHVHWIHAIHGRLCYIPIVVAAAWFGIRGGVYTAILISALLVPFLTSAELEAHALADEIAEIFFYFAIAILSGALFDRELSARQKAEEAKLQLERSQKLSLVGQIAAGMAHEIKNPLASIKGGVEILGDDSTSIKDKEEFREIIFKEIRRIDSSLSDFLEFAKPSETRRSKTNLSNIVRSSIRQLEVQARESEIPIDASIEEDLFVEADQEKIHQVILNLMLNAVQASQNGAKVVLMLKRVPSDKIVRLTIEDFGEGIKSYDLERVFEPFYTTKSSGTGLGLAIVKSIVDNHGGTISIQNKPMRGVKVTVELPLLMEQMKQ